MRDHLRTYHSPAFERGGHRALHSEEVPRAETLAAYPAVRPAHVAHQDVTAHEPSRWAKPERPRQFLAVSPRHVGAHVILGLTVPSTTRKHAKGVEQRLKRSADLVVPE